MNGVGNGGGGIRDMSNGVMVVVEEDKYCSSMVVSRPSKKWMRFGTALVKMSVVMGGRSTVLLLLSILVRIIDDEGGDASDGQ